MSPCIAGFHAPGHLRVLSTVGQGSWGAQGPPPAPLWSCKGKQPPLTYIFPGMPSRGSRAGGRHPTLVGSVARLSLSVHPSPGSDGCGEVRATLGGQPRTEGEEVGTKTQQRGQLQPFSRLKRRRGPFRPRPPSAAGGQSHRPQCPPSAQGLEKKANFDFLLLFPEPGSSSASALLLSSPFTPCLCTADQPAAFLGGG